MPVSILSSVDLPLPEGPIMLKRLCAGMVNVTSAKMLTFRPCVSNTRETCSIWIRGFICITCGFSFKQSVHGSTHNHGRYSESSRLEWAPSSWKMRHERCGKYDRKLR